MSYVGGNIVRQEGRIQVGGGRLDDGGGNGGEIGGAEIGVIVSQRISSRKSEFNGIVV